MKQHSLSVDLSVGHGGNVEKEVSTGSGFERREVASLAVICEKIGFQTYRVTPCDSWFDTFGVDTGRRRRGNAGEVW